MAKLLSPEIGEKHNKHDLLYVKAVTTTQNGKKAEQKSVFKCGYSD